MSGEDQAIHKAALAGDDESLRRMLDADPALITAAGSFDRTPLDCAAEAGCEECVRLLIRRGAPVDARDSLHSWTPLFEAVGADSIPCACLLLEAGADPNVRDTHRGETPLFHTRSLEMLQLLDRYGADLDVISAANQYPFEYHLTYTKSPELLRFWLERGVDVDHVPGFGWPALQAALTWWEQEKENRNHIERCVDLLLTYDADVDLQDRDGNTPLHVAADNYATSVARKLLDRGADPNIQNHGGETPLHRVVRSGPEELVRLLVERRADVNIRNIYKKSPCDLAGDRPELQAILQVGRKDVPAPRPTPQGVAARLLAIPSIRKAGLKPCSSGDIERLERHFGVTLPRAYREFLLRMGNGAGSFLVGDHWSAFYDDLFEIARDAEYAEEYDLPEGYFVFADRMGEVSLFFVADGRSDDPPVFAFGEATEREPEQLFDSIWDFFDEQAAECEMYHKKGYL
jgi:ankyrin repeat protein